MQPFDRSTPIVDFGVTSQPLRGTKKWVLWPAFAYKVVIPVRSGSAFNLFQRAVLDLCRAGHRSPSEIHTRLALPPELTGFILDQLQGMGMLDEGNVLTQRAVRLLDEEADSFEVEDVGYVFVDGHSRRLWPRLHRGGLPFVEAELEQGNMARFVRGSTGVPERVSAMVIWPSGKPWTPHSPGALEILRAARQHRLRQRAFAREVPDAELPEESSSSSRVPGRAAVKRVRLVSNTPEPILVATFFLQPQDARHQSWLITDPCGLGVSDVLREPARRLAKDGKGSVRELLEQLAGEAWDVHGDDLAHYLAEATQAARDRVAQHLGSATSLLPTEVIQQLANAEERLESARARSAASTKAIEDFIGHAYAALEEILGWLVKLYPEPSVLGVLDWSGTNNVRLLQRIATSLGFSTSERTNILLEVSRGAVKHVLNSRNKTLPGRLVAALLAAQKRSAHPLRDVAAAFPEALEFLQGLHRLRNQASHDSTSVPDMDVAMAARGQLFAFVRALVGADMGTPAGTPGAPASRHITWGADMLLRIRAQAEKAAMEYEGADLLPELRTRLIDMHQAAIVLEKLADSGESGGGAGRSWLRDFVIAAAIVVEAAIGELEKIAPYNPAVAEQVVEDREKNAAQLARAAVSLEFAVRPDKTLPDALAKARPDRIQRAARGKDETLSARVSAHVLTAVAQPEHPLRMIARSLPAFLLHIADIVEVRGHGDEVNLEPGKATEFKNKVQEVVRAVLATLD